MKLSPIDLKVAAWLIATAAVVVTVLLLTGSIGHARPAAVALKDSDKAVIVDISNSGTVSSVIDQIVVADEPWDLAFSPNGEALVVASRNSNKLTVISTDSWSVISTISLPLGSLPERPVFSPDGTKMAVTRFVQEQVDIYETQSWSQVDSVDVPNLRPNRVAFSPSGQTLYVSGSNPSQDTSMIKAYNANNWSLQGTYSNSSWLSTAEAWGLAVTPDGERLIQAVNLGGSGPDYVDIVDSATLTQAAAAAVADGVVNVTVKPDGSEVAATSQNDSAITRIDLSDASIIESIDFGSPIFNDLAYSNSLDNSWFIYTMPSIYRLNTYDFFSHVVTGTYLIGGRPLGVKMMPNRSPVAKFFVSQHGNGVTTPTIFDATQSGDPDGTLGLKYRWDFGDGTTQTTATPVVSHQYSAGSDVTVNLRVEDDSNCPGPVLTGPIICAGPSLSAPYTKRLYFKLLPRNLGGVS